MVELSDTQVAASLLGLNSGLCSDKFCGVDVTRFMKFIANKKTAGALEVEEETDDEWSEEDSDDDDESMADFIVGDDSEDDGPSDRAAFEMDAMLKEKEEKVTLAALAAAAKDEGRTAILPGDGSDDDEDEAERDESFDCPFELNAEKSPFGPGTVYTTREDVHHSITYPEKYFNRGEELKELTLDEYLRLVRIERIKDEDEDEEDDEKAPKKPGKRGRKSNGRFRFADGFALKHSHVQVLRSKHCTLKFSTSPPRHPGPEPPANEEKKHEAWRKRANAYAFYYLTLFRPERNNFQAAKQWSNEEKYDWETFKEHIKKLKNSELQINKLRLERMECVAHSWKSKVKNRKMLADRRGEDRDMWHKDQQAEYKKSLEQDDGAERKFDEFFEEHDEEREAKGLSMERQTSIMSAVHFSDKIKDGLEGYHSGLSESGGPSVRPPGDDVRRGGPSVRFAPSEIVMASDLKKARRKRDDDDTDPTLDGDQDSSSGDDDGLDGDRGGWDSDSSSGDDDGLDGDRGGRRGRRRARGPQHLDPDTARRIRNENAERYLDSRNMSRDQRSVVDTMKSHFDALNDGRAKEKGYEAPVLLVTGGPGVGKSYVVHTLAGLAKEMDAGDQVRMAYIGIAAVGIDGYSACSLMDIPTDFDKQSRQKARPWSKDRLSQFKQKFNPEKISCVIFDEISTVKPEVLGYLNHRLQEATQCDKPFGGLALIMLGDFDQMKPVGASCTIPATIMKREYGLVRKVKKHTLRDNRHQVTKVGGSGLEVFKKARHMRLEQQHRSLDEDHTNLLAKMSRGEELDSEDFDDYMLLGEGGDGDEDFRFATVLVSSPKRPVPMLPSFASDETRTSRPQGTGNGT